MGRFCKIEDYRVREGRSRVLGIGCYLLIKSCATLLPVLTVRTRSNVVFMISFRGEKGSPFTGM